MLGDTFLVHFLPYLDCSHLREMHLSVLGLTRLSGPHIVEYISSPRCHLHTLKANGNRLGLRAVRSIVRAVHRRNFTLHKLELYTNALGDSTANGSGADEDTNASASVTEEEGEGSGFATGRSTMEIWQACENELKKVLLRNEQLKKATEREALALLRTARTVLLRSKGSAAPSPSTYCSDNCACSETVAILLPISPTTLFSSIGQPISVQPAGTFPFTRLPTEIQLHILSFLAPILSSAQRIRIYQYASSPTTLPPLLPSLTGRGGCIPDPSSLPFGIGAPGTVGGIGGVGGCGGLAFGAGMKMRKRAGNSASVGSGVSLCANGKCMGAGSAMVCAREEERTRWLASVKCNAFELEEDGPLDLDEVVAYLGPD